MFLGCLDIRPWIPRAPESVWSVDSLAIPFVLRGLPRKAVVEAARSAARRPPNRAKHDFQTASKICCLVLQHSGCRLRLYISFLLLCAFRSLAIQVYVVLPANHDLQSVDNYGKTHANHSKSLQIRLQLMICTPQIMMHMQIMICSLICSLQIMICSLQIMSNDFWGFPYASPSCIKIVWNLSCRPTGLQKARSQMTTWVEPRSAWVIDSLAIGL